jgi:hypothetical protein
LLHQSADDVTQAMRLLLACDVTRDATRVLDVLLPVEHFENRTRLFTLRVPEVDREDQ